MSASSRQFFRIAAISATLLVLSACGGPRMTPAPVIDGSAATVPSTKPDILAGGEIAVQRGDSLYNLARRHGVGLRALIDANDLSPPYTIYPGQKLRLPAGGIHVVTRGDSVYALADRYQVEPGAIVRINRLQPPYRLTVGQRLVLPARAGGQGGVRTVATSETSDAEPDSIPRPRLKPKQKERASAANPARTPARTVRPSRPVPAVTGPPPSRSGRGFLWPVSGRIAARFGSVGKGLQNDGINILAPRGTPVRAVENGVVAYAGNELRGFGNLLLIKHDGGWISAYAHNAELLVRSGERVRRGQIISKVGSSGSVDTPQLHFELRRGNRAVDPENHLGKRAARLAKP